LAETQGPSGQQPQNPFFSNLILPGQSTGLKGDVTINTSSAKKAFEDLQSLLTGMMRSYGEEWGNVTNDSLKKQERFYRAIGDKESERRAMLTRYKNEAIAAIDAETVATIAGLEEKARAGQMAHEELEKQKTETTLKAENVRKNIVTQTEKSIKQEGGLLSKIQAVSNKVGGPIGGLVSGVANIIAEPEIAIPAAIIGAMIEIANKRAAFTKTGIQLAGAGFGQLGEGAATTQTKATGFDVRLFRGLNGAISPEEQRAIIGGMATSRTMISQATGTSGMEAVRGNLGLFANVLPDAAKEMELFTDATKSLGMSQKDISTTFFQSSKNAKDLKITQLDAIATQIEMQKALRNITNDGTVAASVLDNVGGFFKDIGKSETERTRMTLGIAQAGANLTLPQMTGMATFVNGGKMPTFEAMFGAPSSGIGPSNGGIVGNPFSMMGQFIQKVGNQFKDPMQRMFVADALNKQLNLGIQIQDLPKLFALSEQLVQGGPGGITQEDYAKKVQDLSKAGKQMSIEGMEKLTEIVGPIKEIENFFENFWTLLDARVQTITSSVNHINPFAPLSNKEVTEKNIKREIDKKKFPALKDE